MNIIFIVLAQKEILVPDSDLKTKCYQVTIFKKYKQCKYIIFPLNRIGKASSTDPRTFEWQGHNEQVEWEWKTDSDAVEPVSPWRHD